MTLWAVVTFWALLSLAIGHAVIAIPFLWRMARRRDERTGPTAYPKTAVILCLRGSDPFLAACLEAVLHQDYPCYDVRIVVDSVTDPAWRTVEQVVARCGATHVQVQPLTARRQTCSLKCSSLLQAITQLDESYEAIALLDADTIAHRTWLRELVVPLADDRVGAATGNRWYMPATITWGSLARWLWNAAAVTVMYAFRIPWGGTLALKMKVVRQSDLLDRWANAFCEDTMLYAVLRRLGCRVAFVPSLMMVNRETCSLPSFCRWVRRQLLNTRLYHPAWAMIAGHSILMSIAHLAGIACLATALIRGDTYAAGWPAAGIGLYWGMMTALLVAMEASVRRTLAARGEPTDWLKTVYYPRVAAAMVLTQAAYPIALSPCLFLRTVEWRGVRYRVEGPQAIHMIEQRSCVDPHKSGQSLQSL